MPQLATIVAAILAFSAIFGQAKGNSSPVRNFKEVTRNSTHVTFSWYVDRAYTSYISSFYIYARHSYPGESSYSASNTDYFSTSSTVQTTSGSGTTYKYGMPVTAFGYYSQFYIMWVQPYTPSASTSYIYSEQILTQLGIARVFEMKIKLWTGQTCFDLLSSASSSDVANEVYRALRIHCQCTFDFIDSFRVVPGYFNCAPTGYITYRAPITTRDASHQPSSLVSTLSNWLHNPIINNITINGLKYTVEPGDCGVTVPDTNAPYCPTSISDDDPTTASPALNSATASTQAVVSSDNTAVIIAAVFGAMFVILTLGLIGYILAVRRPFKKVSSQASSPPQEIPRSDPAPNPYFNNSGPGSSVTITGASVNRQRPPIARGPLPCKPDQEHEVYEPLRV